MIQYLIDTNVLSAGAPGGTGYTRELTQWMLRHTRRLYMSVVTLAEINQGIAKARRRGATRKASSLGEWAELILLLYGDKILPINLDVARLTGMLSDLASAKGHSPGFADAALAATASVHGMMVLTRNVRHFEVLGMPIWDPFAALPP